jgi:hypothetical protein
MMERLRASPLAPWAGFFVGMVAWFVHHQLGSDANFWDCHTGSGPFVVATGVVCGLVVIGGGLVSWWAVAPDTGAEAQNRRFARAVGLAAAVVFLLAIAFQTLAGVLVPACHR